MQIFNRLRKCFLTFNPTLLILNTNLRSLIKVLLLSTFLWLLTLNTSFGQGTSNKGTDFWVAYTGHINGTNSRLTLFITSQQNAVVNIDAGGSVLAPVNVLANQSISVLIDPTVRTNTYVGTSDVVESKKGIHITSNVPIVVYSLISISARSAATLILPTKALGNEYYAMSYTQAGAGAFSEFTIVGVEDATTVEITPTARSSNNARLAGATFQITLNKGDIYQYQSLTDITGSKIKTIGNCKPIAVFSGSSWTGFCQPGSTVNNPSGSDNLYQQLFPVSAWGKNFITAPFYNASRGSVDIFRVYVAEDNTTVTVNGSTTLANSTSLSNPYSKGSVITFYGNTANVISADKPISVAQLQISQNCNTANNPGDPEMTILNPVEQTLKDVTLFSALRNLTTPPTNIIAHYINILLKTADIPTLTLDGVKPNGPFIQINSEYSYIIIDVTASSNVNPTHRIICNNGFSAIAYGYGNVESYAYLAGADIKNLNTNIQIFEPGNNISKSSICSGYNYDVTLQIPYITSKIVWNLNNGALIDTINTPTPTQSTVNGSTAYLYQYKLSAQSLKTTGLYSLTATVINPQPTGCSADEDISINFDVLPVPVSAFTSDTQQSCISIPITFTDATVSNSATIVKWYWNFGDGTKEIKTTGDPVQHVYSAPGDYDVTLITETDGGCQSSPTAPMKIHINKLPAASFTVPTLKCETQAFQFTDKSAANEGTIIGWNWDFGDGNTSTAQNPLHAFAAAGKYPVKLTVQTDKGCTSNVYALDVIVNELPEVDFEVPDFCLADGSAQFTNKTTISDGTGAQLTYLWDFGDPLANAQRPNTSTVKDASHRYTKAGKYTVRLTVKSANGCEETITKLFVVNGGVPKADFNVKNPGGLCSNGLVEFEDKVIVELDEEVTKIEWIYDFANNPSIKVTDDNPALRAEPTRIYTHKYPTFTSPASITYQVRMLAYTGGTCVNVITKSVTVLAVPLADFEMPPSCLINGTATFTNRSSIDGPGLTMSYSWDFGDSLSTALNPNTSTEVNPQHKYSKAGDYIVKLTVTSSSGCSTTLVKTLSVAGSVPNASFTVLSPDKLCSDAPVIFEDQSSISFGDITKIEWYYDYGNNPTLKFTDDNPAKRTDPPRQYSYSYPTFFSPATKTVIVRMLAFSGLTCVDEELVNVTLHAVPRVQFDSIPDICSDSGPVQLTQAKEIHGVLSGTGTYTGKGVSASGIFNQANAGVGTHTLTYTFVADNGCIDSKTQTVTVNPVPTAELGPDLFVLDGRTIKLPATVTGNIVSYKWSPSTYLDKDDILFPSATPTDDITYTLTVTTDKGCTASSNVFIKVLKMPQVPNTFTPNGDGVNDTWNVKYLEDYPGATVDIFNRYGEKLYQIVNYLSPWDGTKNGSGLPVGTYYYIINPKNERKLMYGSVTILR